MLSMVSSPRCYQGFQGWIGLQRVPTLILSLGSVYSPIDQWIERYSRCFPRYRRIRFDGKLENRSEIEEPLMENILIDNLQDIRFEMREWYDGVSVMIPWYLSCQTTRYILNYLFNINQKQ